MLKPNSTILVCAAHVDDAEIGCGATIARLAREGHFVHVRALTSVGPDNAPIAASDEFPESMKILGVPDATALMYPMRMLDQRRRDLLDYLFDLRHELNPDLVFTHSSNDYHRDHWVVAEESKRAFKGITTLAYEMPWNHITFSTHCFISVNQEDLDKKIQAIMSYKSMIDRAYVDADYVRSLAVTRGVNAQSKYAEAFEVVRWVF